MAKDTLLKEAIADAKMVKEAAIANAMITLKESFKPQLSSMLAAKLRNEEESYGDEAMGEQKKLDSSEIGSGAVTVNNPGPKKPSAVASSSSDIENPEQEVETFGEGIEDMFDDESEDELGGEVPAADVGMQGDDEFGDDEFGDEEGEEDDLDLEAIIRELEADLMGAEGGDDMSMEGFDDVDAGEEVDGAVTMETVDGDGDDGVHRDGKSHPATHGFNGGKQVSAGQKVTETTHDDGDEEVDLEEILREMEADDDGVDESSEYIATENVELKRSLREHREVIKLLRSRINEVTLLNNKLMYTTKIFRNFTLSEGQKKKVVEQFDRASTLREAKLVYSTIAESYGVRGATPVKVASKITEGASKTVASTKPKSQTVLNEGDAIVARLQKLAGIQLNG